MSAGDEYLTERMMVQRVQEEQRGADGRRLARLAGEGRRPAGPRLLGRLLVGLGRTLSAVGGRLEQAGMASAQPLREFPSGVSPGR